MSADNPRNTQDRDQTNTQDTDTQEKQSYRPGQQGQGQQGMQYKPGQGQQGQQGQQDKQGMNKGPVTGSSEQGDKEEEEGDVEGTDQSRDKFSGDQGDAQ
jgi:hypothetical protein